MVFPQELALTTFTMPSALKACSLELASRNLYPAVSVFFAVPIAMTRRCDIEWAQFRCLNLSSFHHTLTIQILHSLTTTAISMKIRTEHVDRSEMLNQDAHGLHVVEVVCFYLPGQRAV